MPKVGQSMQFCRCHPTRVALGPSRCLSLSWGLLCTPMLWVSAQRNHSKVPLQVLFMQCLWSKPSRRGQACGRHASAHTLGSGLLLFLATGHVPKAKSLSSGQNKPGHIYIFPPEALPLTVPALPLWIPSTHARSAPEMF